MTAIEGEPPAVARQRVRRALRSAREALATPMSQGAVAKRLGWSLSKMQRIEGGEVAVSATDLKALLDVYGVDDPHTVEQLTEDTRISRRQRYVTAPEYREHLTPATRELMQFETEAVAVRAFQPVFYPGPLQTPAVAKAVLGWWRRTIPAEGIRIRYEVRMLRRRQLLERDHGPDLFVVLDESVIRRPVGSTSTTMEQLELVADVAERDDIHIRVLPFRSGPYFGPMSAFQVIDLSADPGDSVLYREVYDHDETIHDRKEVQLYRDAFEQLWMASLSEGETAKVLRAEAERLRTSDLGGRDS